VTFLSYCKQHADDDERILNSVERARILIIDDDENTRSSLLTVLEEEGYEVDVASSGYEAVAKSEMSSYDLAFIDPCLPDMDGTRLLSEMRETVPGMARIIMTGCPSLGDVIDAVNQGVDSYMVKPFRVDDLLLTIEKSLKKQREAKRYSEETVKDYIETRFREAAVIG